MSNITTTAFCSKCAKKTVNQRSAESLKRVSATSKIYFVLQSRWHEKLSSRSAGNVEKAKEKKKMSMHVLHGSKLKRPTVDWGSNFECACFATMRLATADPLPDIVRLSVASFSIFLRIYHCWSVNFLGDSDECRLYLLVSPYRAWFAHPWYARIGWSRWSGVDKWDYSDPESNKQSGSRARSLSLSPSLGFAHRTSRAISNGSVYSWNNPIDDQGLPLCWLGDTLYKFGLTLLRCHT